jgi:hypothetical protein
VESEQESNRTIANRENARRSTGPRTHEGKRVSSGNALDWGFWSQKALIPGGDPGAPCTNQMGDVSAAADGPIHWGASAGH